MTGRVVGTYKIVSKLGEGGMGAVYKGIDTMVEREVAIKMLRPEIARQPEVVERFRSEAVTLAKLNHHSIATLFSFFREGNEFFMVMEYVPGRTLDAILRESGAMPPERAVEVLAKMLEGIEHAHELGILHRDIKPANIMITGSGAVKVTDFGIARVLGAARMTREGNIVGTIEYMAPERIRGQEADLRSDIYSLGAVLYEMLSGHLPFERDTEYELMKAQIEEPPPPLLKFGVHVPDALQAVVEKALAKDPGDRFSTAGEFRAALLEAMPVRGTRTGIKETRLAEPAMKPTRLATAPTGPAAQSAAARPAVRSKFGWKLYAGAVAILVLALAAGIWLAMRPGKPASATTPPRPAVPVAQPQAQPAVATEPPPGLQPGQPGAKDILEATPAIPAKALAPEKAEGARPAVRRSLSLEERRKAALAALEKSEEDRRKAAMKALEK